MKFLYVDESGPGSDGKSDVFTMCGVMVDAYKIRKKTADFDQKLKSLHQITPGMLREMKTSRFINGKGAWKEIDEQERRNFLTEVCQLAVENGGKIFGIGFSIRSFKTASKAGLGPTTKKRMNHWLSGAIFISCLVQKKMQSSGKNKGLTVVIMDDNEQEMSSLSDQLYECDPWYDGLYQIRDKRPKKTGWLPRRPSNRLDHIINTAFAIKSHHSSLIQVADVISYVYRRYLELMSLDEVWIGERDYYKKLVKILEPAREKLGQCPTEELCVEFFKQTVHTGWKL